jgi:membrane protease subunit (stomatin/prohibitin family)
VTMREFLAGEFIDIVEWLDETDDTMVWRFSRPRNEIKNGAQLIVRPGQVAVFVEQGEIADVFEPGRHTLTTENLPVLSRLRGWRFGFASPFKAEIVYASTRQFVGRKWGTANPVIVRDPEIGPARLRAYGTYAIRVADAPCFVRELVGTNSIFLIDQIVDQLRDLVVAKVSTSLADGGVSVIELAAKYPELGSRVRDRAASDFAKYGLELTNLVIENVSLPPEVEAALDQRSKMQMIGNLDQYAALQAADALRDAARNPSGGAAAGVGIGMGAAISQRAMASTEATRHAGAPPDLPPPIPTVAWYYAVGTERRGPVDTSSLEQLVAAGGVSPSTLLWRSGMKDWVPASGIDEMKAPFAKAGRG